MPCSDDGYDKWIEEELRKDPEKMIKRQLSRVDYQIKELVNYLKTRLDTTTRLLCFTCKQIELGDNANTDCAEAKELREWWKAHKEADKQREGK